MGRYLSCAVATSMVIEEKNDKHFEKEELDKLKQSMKRGSSESFRKMVKYERG